MSMVRAATSWRLAAGRCPDRCAIARKEAKARAQLNKARKARAKEQQAGLFQAMMGLEGEGNLTLAEGLEDVDVRFSRRRRANWTVPGRRRKRKAKLGPRASNVEASKRPRRSSAGRTRGREGFSWAGDDTSTDCSDSGGESDFTDDLTGCSGDEGGDDVDHDLGVQLGDLLRIFWTEEGVWFRCRVTGVGHDGGRVRVEYLLPGWEPFIHDLNKVQWERWSEGGEVDPDEASYHPEVWMGPEDSEAAAAADGARQRATATGGRQDRQPAAAREGEEDEPAGRSELGGGVANSAAASGGDEGSEQYGWMISAVNKGKGAKKRKVLAQRLVAAWRRADRTEGRMAAVDLRTVYRLMGGAMTTRCVKEELKQMARAGIVILENDTVVCGQRPCQGTSRNDAAGTDGGVGGSGDTRVGKRTRAARSEADCNREGRGGDAGEVEGEGSAVDEARAGGRRHKRRCARPVYVESEQESAESEGDWV